MPLTQGSALPDVNTTTSQTTTAPQFYTDYMSNLAKAGNAATSMDPSKMVAGFSDLQNQGFGQMGNAASSYQPQLNAASQTAADVAGGVNQQDINQFMNPYMSGVVNQMALLSGQNVQRNLLPQMKGMFTASGGLGSQRMANATGQALADVQSSLTGQQTGALQKGYQDAVNAALQQSQLENMAAQTQGSLAEESQRLGLTGAKSLLDAGAIKQAYNQAMIEAPLKMATNASGLLRGYNAPTSTTQKFTGPMPGAYSASPLQNIAGVASLFAANRGGVSAGTGGIQAIKDAYSWLKSLGSGNEAQATDDWINKYETSNLP